MPTKNRWKCLNPNCSSLARRGGSLIFDAMTAPMPACPSCGCTKVEDWGPAISIGVHTSGRTAGTDATLRRLADAHGLTDISNRDGGAAKGAAVAQPGEVGKYGNINIGGVECPVNDRPTGAWGKTAYTAFKAKTGNDGKLPGRAAARTEVAKMTQVVAEHKGA